MASVAVETADIQNRYEGDLSRFSGSYVETQITDAIDFIDSLYPVVQARLDSGLLTVNAYKRVVADVVLRVLRNPNGYTNETDGAYSYGQRAAVASGNLWLTNDNVAVLTGPQFNTTPGTIALGVERGWGR